MQFHNLYMLMKYAHNYGHKQIKNVGISATEHLICKFVIGHTDSSQDQISEYLQLDKATIAKALVSLENKGYIERKINPDNRRKNIINITDSGRELMLPLADVYDTWVAKLSDALTEEEWEQFNGYSAKILEVAKRLNQEV